MIETVLTSIISSAVGEIIKMAFNKKEEPFEQNVVKEEFVPETVKSVLDMLSDTDKRILTLYLGHSVFQAALLQYLTRNSTYELISYFDRHLLKGDRIEPIMQVIYNIKKSFDRSIISKSSKPVNGVFIEHTSKIIIPGFFSNSSDLLNKIKSISMSKNDGLIFYQLSKLLENAKLKHERESKLYSQHGVSKELIAEMARLEFEINDLVTRYPDFGRIN